MTFQFDALVLIHAYATTPRNPDYTSNVLSLAQQAKEAGSPVLVLGGFSADPLARYLIHEGAVSLPRENYSDQVNAIVAAVGKNPEDISVGVGGTVLEACVNDYAGRWCKEWDFKGPRP